MDCSQRDHSNGARCRGGDYRRLISDVDSGAAGINGRAVSRCDRRVA